jgi:hypothetical protein
MEHLSKLAITTNTARTPCQCTLHERTEFHEQESVFPFFTAVTMNRLCMRMNLRLVFVTMGHFVIPGKEACQLQVASKEEIDF